MLNAQITTLSNTPKTSDDSSITPGTIPVSYSTKVTISEEPITSTQRISALFAKRTRPTTVKPQDLNEQTTTDNKVSFDRKYASIKRTYTPASSNTPSPSQRARLPNEVSFDSRKGLLSNNDSDSDLGETNDTLVKGRPRKIVRKIRSTTPASQENQDNAGTLNYGNKRYTPRSRYNTRRVNQDTSSEGEVTQPDEDGLVLSNNDGNGFQPRNRLNLPSRTFGLNRNTNNRFRTPQIVDNEGSGNEFIKRTEFVSTTNSPRSTPSRRFRPSVRDFDSDLSSLTAIDKFRSSNENIEDYSKVRNAQTNRRFRPRFNTFVKDEEDDTNSESTESSRSTFDRQRSISTRRGSRFTTEKVTSSNEDFELNTEASESALFPLGRKVGIARFTPRPFSISTTNIDFGGGSIREFSQKDNELNSDVIESKLVGTARLTAPVINVSGEQRSRLNLGSSERTVVTVPQRPRPNLGSSERTAATVPQRSINVTKVINSNIFLGQSNNRSGILLLRRPSRPLQTTLSPSDENDFRSTKSEEALENIHLSESNISEEKEDDERINDLAPERPKKRIVVKKLRSTTASSETLTTTEIPLVGDDAKNEENNNDGEITTTPKPRIRKVIRKKLMSTTTTIGEVSTTEKIVNNVDETTEPSQLKNEEQTTALPKIRKVIRRKLRPILTEDGKTRILQVKNEESIQESNTDTPVESTSELPTTYTASSISEIVQIDLLSEQTTELPSSTKSKVERPSYRPVKRPINILTSTEPTTTTAKVYSRKYNNAPFTNPTPLDREPPVVTERSRIETSRRPTFNSRPINRRPFTTARTTTTDEEEYNSEEDEVEEENPENTLVFVPIDQLYTRGPLVQPSNTGRKTESEPEVIDDNATPEDEYESEEDEEEQFENEERDNKNVQITPTTRFSNRFNPTPKPLPGSIRNANANAREPNRPFGFNRPISNRPAAEDPGRRFNRPVAFQPNNRPVSRFGPSSASPLNSTKSYTRKYSANRPTEPSVTTEEINVEAINAKHKQLFSNPKRFTTTTLAPSSDSGTEDSSTDVNSDSTTYVSNIESETDIDFMLSTTEESSTLLENAKTEDITTNNLEDSNEITTSESMISNTESILNENTPTTEKHQISTLNEQNESTSSPKTEENTLYPIFSLLTTVRPINKTKIISENDGLVKTSSHLDKLFSVSRVVEISSSQEKHRLNKKNESRLIEKTEIKQEQKPTLDKIGEVSRYTLIKIVEGDIPIYLTNLSHEYPVENPPFNPIRIDEARNARALRNFADSGKENLIASETVNSAYNHRNTLIDIIDAPTFSEIQRQKSLVEPKGIDEIIVTTEKLNNEMSTTTSEKHNHTSIEPDKGIDQQFGIVTVKSNTQSESSTIALEGLFNSNNSNIVTARQVGDNSNRVSGTQPFVVYAAPPKTTSDQIETISVSENKTDSTTESETPSGRSIANFVKIQVVHPGEDLNVKVNDKGDEFLGVPGAVDAILQENITTKAPFTVSILKQDNDQANNTKIDESSKTEPIVISLPSLDSVVLQKANESSTTSTTTAETDKAATPTITQIVLTTTEIPTTTTTEAPVTNSKILNVKPVTITDTSLSNIAKKRPKLTFPRRPPIKSSNITRISVSPSTNSVSKNKTTTVSPDGKNIPFTTPKYNRTNSYTSGRSRFSANRSQNVPVDTRKQKIEVTKLKINSTTESSRPSSYEPSRKITIKPFRPLSSRRTTTAAPTQVSQA